MKFKINFDHIPRRFLPTTAELQEIRSHLHLRAQLPPGDPNNLAVCGAAKASWGGALRWEIGRLWQDERVFLVVGVAAWIGVAVANFLGR